jgi:alanine dehydrogenase
VRIGLPREIKDGERRVALTPAAVSSLKNVVFEKGAGAGAGFADDEYLAAGATPGDPWQCELVVKVKELQAPELRRPRPGQVLFGFQHFGPHPELLDAALASGATFVAYETVGEADGRLPILSPMSAIAGRLAVQAGMWCLQTQNGGSGVLLPGLDGVPPGKVAIVGAGNVGANALAVAHGLGAQVSIFAKSDRRFSALRRKFPNASYRAGLERATLADADLIIAGVLTPGQMSPKLIDRRLLAQMRPGSVLVDVGIDQGGIAETSRPTSHSRPTYVEEGVVHYCVPNLPAACARTASLALSHAVLPYLQLLAEGRMSDDLATGVQVRAGKVVHAKLARDTGR